MLLWDGLNRQKQDKLHLVAPENALPGRETPVLLAPQNHAVLHTPILGSPQANEEVIYLASGCFWGAEKLMWELEPVTTSVGYMGGYTPNPTYQEVCTGLTGHTETVRVVYDPALLPLDKILQVFFESHDPTSLNKQGGDIGTQYRSAIFTTTPEQAERTQRIIAAYQEILTPAGFGPIVTEIHTEKTPYYPAEEYHQQYLHKNPNGYQCHARTGLPCPLPGSSPLSGQTPSPLTKIDEEQ